MSDIDLPSIKRKSLRGIFALQTQSLVVQLTGIFATGFQLAFLTRTEFGIFGVVNSIISIFTYFSDVGLAGALIQKKEEITKNELKTTFTIQQILICCVIAIGFFGSTVIASFYSLSEDGVFLFKILLLCFFLSSLKTIPSVLLERKLDFHKWVIPQISETLTYNILLAIFAWQGFGIKSFAWAALARSVIGLIIIYYLSPWDISFGFSKSVVKKLFRFGVPFQTNSLLALIKDDLLFIFLGKILPFSDMGFIFVAKRLAELPLRWILDSVMRVTFPTYSRLEGNVLLLRKGLEKTLFGISAIVFPLYVGMIFFISHFIALFPKYKQWEPALMSFYFMCVTSIVSSLSIPLTNGLNAIGKIKITLLFMLLWIVMTWILVVVFVRFIGFNGYALSLMLISGTIVIVVSIVKRFVLFSFWGSIQKAFLSGILLSAWYAVSLYFIPKTLIFLIPVGLTGIILYGFTLYYFEKEKIKGIISSFK